MKAEELMINDWVLDWLTKMPLQVNGMCIRQAERSKESIFEPIPLTKEILKANGFILKGKTSEYDYDSYYKCYVDKDYNTHELNFTPANGCIELFWKNRIYGIKYVHEVQHALRLCGLNNIADNFKV